MTDAKLIAELLELAKRVGREAGELLQNRPAAFEVTSKSTAIDVVTQMDSQSENHIVSEILKARPGDGIIGENFTNVKAITVARPHISMLPLNLGASDGAPVRAIASW